MKKIPFIEYRKDIQDKDLNRLFNIVVNYYGLNNPEDVGYCVKIYNAYFESTNNWDFNNAIDFFMKEIGEEKRKKILNYLEEIGKLSNSLIKELNSDFRINAKFRMSREEQYSSILNKTFSILFRDSNEKTISEMKSFGKRLSKYSVEEINKFGKKYLSNLLTIESMIGTIIENDILQSFSVKYDVFKSDLYLEKKDVDGIINGNFVSIKSIKYKSSPYKKVASNNIEKFINGPIILYKIIGDSYEIFNLEEVNEFVSKKGTKKAFNLKKVK